MQHTSSKFATENILTNAVRSFVLAATNLGRTQAEAEIAATNSQRAEAGLSEAIDAVIKMRIGEVLHGRELFQGGYVWRCSTCGVGTWPRPEPPPESVLCPSCRGAVMTVRDIHAEVASTVDLAAQTVGATQSATPPTPAAAERPAARDTVPANAPAQDFQQLRSLIDFAVLSRISAEHRGQVVTAEMLDGVIAGGEPLSVPSVLESLKRLAHAGSLRRVDRGRYILEAAPDTSNDGTSTSGEPTTGDTTYRGLIAALAGSRYPAKVTAKDFVDYVSDRRKQAGLPFVHGSVTATLNRMRYDGILELTEPGVYLLSERE